MRGILTITYGREVSLIGATVLHTEFVNGFLGFAESG